MLNALGRPVVDLPAPSPEDTLVWMRQLAHEAQNDVRLRMLVEKIVANVFQRDYLSEYAAILNWVRRNVRYVRDPRTIEQVATPASTISRAAGDCDDMAVLIAALVGLVGGASRFTAGAFKRAPDGSPVLAHVWCEAYDPNTQQWIVLDPVPGRSVDRMLGGLIHQIQAPAIE